VAKAAGHRVLVLERHHTAGGLTHVFHRPGFEWDVGLHYVGQVHQPGSDAAALFDYFTDGTLQWTAMPDVYDRIDIDGFRFDYVSGRDRLRTALHEAFPHEIAAVDRYFETIGRCLAAMPLFYVEKMLPGVVRRPLGSGLRAPFVHYARQTTADVLAQIGASRELAAVLAAQWGDYGLPPGQSSFAIHAIVAAHYFDGGAYPVGGASRIARALLPAIERAGGTVVVSAEVNRVVLCGDRAIGVRMKDGREFRAPVVVSDAGLVRTFTQLLPEQTRATARLLERVTAIGPSHAHIGLYAGAAAAKLRRPLPAANLWLHPSLDFDCNWDAFAADLDAPFPLQFISFPSAKDPEFEVRHPGHQTIEIVVPAPYDAFAVWSRSPWKHRGDDYSALKQRLQDRMLEALYRHVPGVEGAIETCEVSTPLSTQHFTNAWHGESYGLAHTPARFLSRDLTPTTPIRGLFLTGQDVSTCGVAGALAGAVACASAVLRRNMFRVAGSGQRAA
jgi:all-trans-retinol 13,14-reductase